MPVALAMDTVYNNSGLRMAVFMPSGREYIGAVLIIVMLHAEHARTNTLAWGSADSIANKQQ